MTEGKQGAAEWLRGIIDKCEVDRMRSCTAIAEAFGIDCKHEKSRRDCITRMMTDIAGRIDLEMMENERLKKENAELKAELADWKGNAEGFQPDAYMKLPLDADGEPIRVGDVLYSSGNEFRVVNITVKANEVFVAVYADDGTFCPWVNPKYLSRKNTEPLGPEPADSWERLEEDANLGCRDYCEKYRLEECDYNMRLHILARAKKLAKAGEVE